MENKWNLDGNYSGNYCKLVDTKWKGSGYYGNWWMRSGDEVDNNMEIGG